MKFTRILSAALVGVMLLSCTAVLGGCRKKQVPVKSTVDHVYRVTKLEKPEGMNYAQQFFAANDRIYMSYRYVDSEAGVRENRTYSMALDGTDLKQEELSVLTAPTSEDENTHINVQNFAAAGDGSIWRVLYTSTYNMKTGEASEKHYLQKMTMDGKELLNIDAETLWGPPSDDPNNRVWHYIDFLVPVADGVMFTDNQTLYFIGDDGSVKARIDMTEMGGNGWMNSIFSTENGPVLLYSDYSTNKQKLSLIPVNAAAGQLGTPVELDSTVFQNVYNFYSGPGYTFYYGTDEALYGYDMASGTSTMLMNYLNSDITANTVSRLIVISPDLFISNGYDEVTSQQELMLMKRVPEEELVPQYILTLATLGDVWSAQSDVIRFNRLGTEYRITVKNYDPQDYYVDTTAEYDYQAMVQQALTALNNDIIAGKIPDILMVNEYIQMDNYISKGIFADLNKYIENDERFKREDFLTNVLDAFSIDGKLYELAPAFNVQTLVGKKSMIGDRTGWTMKEFVEWTKTIPEDAKVFYDITRDQLLEMFCINAYEEFVDTDTGKCYFDTEDFKLVLEYVKTLSTKSVWEEMEESGGNNNAFWQEYEYRFRDNKAMLEQLYLSNFTALASAMSHTFYSEEELVLVGLPSMDRSGSVITASPSYAISAQSVLADGAWQFVSMFLTKEYQDDLTYQFPIRIDSLEKMAAKQVEEQQKQKKQYEERMANQNGGNYYGGAVTMPAIPETVAPAVQSAPAILIETASVTEIAVETTAAAETTTADTKPADEKETAETTGPVDANGDGIMDDDIAVIDPVIPVQNRQVRIFLDQEMADEMIAFLKTVNHARRNNTKVNNIIKEEASAYFAGDKPLEETVKLIQNRVSILVAESR